MPLLRIVTLRDSDGGYAVSRFRKDPMSSWAVLTISNLAKHLKKPGISFGFRFRF